MTDNITTIRALPEITQEDREFLSDNQNTDDIVEGIEGYAKKAVTLSEPVLRPSAWARKWFIDGETPRKERKLTGRLAWPTKYKFLPVTHFQCLQDDVPLYLHQPAPAWHDAPTEPGLWVLDDGTALVLESGTLPKAFDGLRWYGPIPEDDKAEGGAAIAKAEGGAA